MSASGKFVDPFELLLRRGKLDQLLTFFMRLEERMTLAFPSASRILADSLAPSAKQVRGGARRHFLQEALISSARDAGLYQETKWTDPATWSFPLVKLGGFSLTIGIVETRYRGASRALRSKSKYVADLCQRNSILDPQSTLFDKVAPSDAVIADGAMGGLLVAQFSHHSPDQPAFLGFWVPSEKLSSAYYVRSVEEIIAMLRQRLSLARKPTKRTIERKPLKRRVAKPSDKKA